MIPMLFNQLQLVAMRKFDFPLSLAAMEPHQVSTVCVIPPIVLPAASPLVEDFKWSSLQLVGEGNALVWNHILAACPERFNGVTMRQDFGLTETEGACQVSFPVFDVVGILLPNIEARIVEVESGEALPSNQKEGLSLRGRPLIMQGYLNTDKTSTETLDKEGWLHIGDLGYFDDDGYLYTVDSVKELIKHIEFQVPLRELEAVLPYHPVTLDAGVTGCPHEQSGEGTVAFVMEVKDREKTEDDMIHFVDKKVGDPNIPCDNCKGRGWLVCELCEGRKINVQVRNSRFYRRCPNCRAAGVVICPRCKVFKCVSFPDDKDGVMTP